MTVVLSDDFFMTKTVIPNKFFEILMSRNGTENVLNALTIKVHCQDLKYKYTFEN